MIERNKQPPVPDDLREYLNELQVLMINRMGDFGWDLWFVRRPVFQDSVCVIVNRITNQTAVIEDDGSVNYGHQIEFRN